MSTPTPRTDAAWARAFDLPEFSAAHTARTMRDECAKLERELAHQHETSRLLKVAMDVRDDGYTEMRKLLSKVETALATERARVRTLRDACESICEEWGDNYNTNPIGAGLRMATRAGKVLEAMEGAE